MIDIKPSVVQDYTTIRDKFPCNRYALQFLNHFVSGFGFWELFIDEYVILDFVINFIFIKIVDLFRRM